MTKVFEACGQYARTIIVEKLCNECFECEQEKEVLSFDSSDVEYSIMYFCIDCLIGFASGKISKNTYYTKNVGND